METARWDCKLAGSRLRCGEAWYKLTSAHPRAGAAVGPAGLADRRLSSTPGVRRGRGRIPHPLDRGRPVDAPRPLGAAPGRHARPVAIFVRRVEVASAHRSCRRCHADDGGVVSTTGSARSCAVRREASRNGGCWQIIGRVERRREFWSARFYSGRVWTSRGALRCLCVPWRSCRWIKSLSIP